MELLLIVEKGFWSGCAALGFGILFNVPNRTLFAIWAMGFLGGFAKFLLLNNELNIILSTFVGASLIGIISIPLAHKIHSPPLIFSIPAIIPMVPGAFAYRMMLGLMKIAVHSTESGIDEVMANTLQNGLIVIFILLAISVGVAVPMLVTRKESAKKIKFLSPS
jgi:uncharacterized membrane protein YjjB (DUF3815 family)